MSTSIDNLKLEVQNLGLEWFGVVPLKSSKDYARYQSWIDRKQYAGMNYLGLNAQIREDPSLLLPGAQTAIVLGMPYYQGDRLQSVKDKGSVIAQYARIPDYHKLLRKKSFAVSRFIEDTFNCQTRVLVDTAPVLEKALAAKTENGFIGKNTLFIHKDKGSYFLLSEILCAFDFVIDEKIVDEPTERGEHGGCGTCKRCQTFCPTGALSTDYQIDAGKCLAYYNIEHRECVPIEYWQWFRYYLFGCDICQLVCPYNRQAQRIPDEAIKISSDLDLEQIACMDQRTYETIFGGTSLTRAKKVGLQRNALIAMVVTNHPGLDVCIEEIRKLSIPLLDETIAQIPEYLGQMASVL